VGIGIQTFLAGSPGWQHVANLNRECSAIYVYSFLNILPPPYSILSTSIRSHCVVHRCVYDGPGGGKSGSQFAV